MIKLKEAPLELKTNIKNGYELSPGQTRKYCFGKIFSSMFGHVMSSSVGKLANIFFRNIKVVH